LKDQFTDTEEAVTLFLQHSPQLTDKITSIKKIFKEIIEPQI